MDYGELEKLEWIKKEETLMIKHLGDIYIHKSRRIILKLISNTEFLII